MTRRTSHDSKPKRRKPRGPTAAELCDPRPMEFFLKTIRDTGVPADFQARVMGMNRETVKIRREWAMPSADTFSIPHIKEFVEHYVRQSTVSIDPFARRTRLATYRNDINPKMPTPYHMEAARFLEVMAENGVQADLALFDPPYSPRQINECYESAGIACGIEDTQNSALCSRVRKAMLAVLTEDAVVLSFGWNSVGMGKTFGFRPLEILMVCHGGAHNDTICVAERRIPDKQLGLFDQRDPVSGDGREEG